jgi:hypothetical protein
MYYMRSETVHDAGRLFEHHPFLQIVVEESDLRASEYVRRTVEKVHQ